MDLACLCPYCKTGVCVYIHLDLSIFRLSLQNEFQPISVCHNVTSLINVYTFSSPLSLRSFQSVYPATSALLPPPSYSLPPTPATHTRKKQLRTSHSSLCLSCFAWHAQQTSRSGLRSLTARAAFPRRRERLAKL